MTIRLQTSAGHDIPNLQLPVVSDFEKNWSEGIKQRHPRVTLRTGVSPIYNCHGLTFASRRTRIPDSAWVTRILSEDSYTVVPPDSVMPGDIIVYYKDGDATHSGFVICVDSMRVPLIVSKWGSGPEVIHKVFDVPTDVYGTDFRVYRCTL